MKNIYLPLAALTLASTAALAGDPPQASLPQDCEEQVRLATAAVGLAGDYSFNKNDDGSVTIPAEAQAKVEISNIRVVGRSTNPNNEHVETTYAADVTAVKPYNSTRGKVKVTFTRGGCFIDSLTF